MNVAGDVQGPVGHTARVVFVFARRKGSSKVTAGRIR